MRTVYRNAVLMPACRTPAAVDKPCHIASMIGSNALFLEALGLFCTSKTNCAAVLAEISTTSGLQLPNYTQCV